MQDNPYPLRINKQLMAKFKIVAAADGRSVNKQIEALVRQAVAQYEQTNGVIPLEEPREEA